MKASGGDAGTNMTAIKGILDLMGGEVVIGPLHNDRDVIRLVRRGVPCQAVDYFVRISGISFDALDPQVLTLSTFQKRQKNSQPLKQDESDRLLRVVCIVAAAREVFGDLKTAEIWLNRKNRALDGETPLAMADTHFGPLTVEALLGRIVQGIAA
jgi:putative toxin-antitoxin system antitoxin component (TIGR02293 family)